MNQIVGLSCVFCREQIGSISDGRFCESCGCPLHFSCVRLTPSADGTTQCAICGAPRKTEVRPESRPTSPSWLERSRFGEHALYCLLLGVVPGGGWVASGWTATGSPLGGLVAVVANYLLLLLAYYAGVWYRDPVQQSVPESTKVALRNLGVTCRTPVQQSVPDKPTDGNSLVEFVVRTTIVSGVLFSMTILGVFGGCLLGTVIMYPLAVAAKDKWVHEANLLACVGFYLTAGVFLVEKV